MVTRKVTAMPRPDTSRRRRGPARALYASVAVAAALGLAACSAGSSGGSVSSSTGAFGSVPTATGKAVAGTITGMVSAKPPAVPGAAGTAASDPYASRRYKFVDKIDYDALTDFVINIEQHVALPAGGGGAHEDRAT